MGSKVYHVIFVAVVAALVFVTVRQFTAPQNVESSRSDGRMVAATATRDAANYLLEASSAELTEDSAKAEVGYRSAIRSLKLVQPPPTIMGVAKNRLASLLVRSGRDSREADDLLVESIHILITNNESKLARQSLSEHRERLASNGRQDDLKVLDKELSAITGKE
jgi:hypothetical protein